LTAEDLLQTGYKMRLAIFLLLSFTLHAVLSTKPKRPSGFDKEVKDLLADMATANGYGRFDKCHIVHWDFMADMIDDYDTGKRTNAEMSTFIDDLAKIHTDASFYQTLTPSTKTDLKTLTTTYHTKATAALVSNDMADLAKALFNIPSNLYPGNLSNNRSIKNRLDPPKAGSKTVRTSDATKTAKALYKDYQKWGLNIYPDPASPATRAKSSDIPPGDTSGDYVKVV